MLYPLSYRRVSLPTSRTLLSVRPGDKSAPREDGHRAGAPADDGAPTLGVLLRQRPSTCAGPTSPIRRSAHWFPAYIAAPIANQKTMKTTIPTTCQKKSARAQFIFALERLPPKARTSR